MPIFHDRFGSGALDEEGGHRLRTVEDLRVGDSACFIYDHGSDYPAVVVPFVKAGLAERQQVLYVHDTHAPGEVNAMLVAGGIDVGRAQACGQLAFFPASQLYARGADGSVDRVLDQLHALTAMALADGWSALRVTSEMSWALGQPQGIASLLEQESRVAAFFQESAGLGMTQIERGRFPAGALLDVLLAHPVAVVGTQAIPNFYHALPSEGFGSWRSQATLDYWLSNLKARQRAAGCLRETSREGIEASLPPSDEWRQRTWKSEVVERLAGSVAHDMNDALNAIIAFADLALQGAGEDDGLCADIGEIREAAGRAADITRRLLAFSRRQSLPVRTIALNSIVSHALDTLHRLIGEPAALEMKLGHDAGNVRTDPTHIEQVIINLALSAREVVPHGGSLLIETESVRLEEGQPAVFGVIPPGDYAVIRILDKGRKPSPEALAHAFQPFFTSGRGPGLGRPSVRGIARQSGGWIRVRSEFDKETCAEIYLQRLAADDDSESAERTAGEETVLLVEDEALVRRVVARVLARAGYRVLAAGGGAEALNLCESMSVPIDLLVTDVVMPGMDGKELAALVARRFPGIKILFMTGYTDEAILREEILHRGRGIMLKPFSPEELLEKTREVLDN